MRQYLVLYLSIPIVLVVILVVIYRVLDSMFPGFISVVTGGRGKGQRRNETFESSGLLVAKARRALRQDARAASVMSRIRSHLGC